MNDVVKYHNHFSNLALTNFTSTEMDLLMTICSKVRDEGSKLVVFDFQQLKSLSQYKPTANIRFIKDLDKTNKRLSELSLTVEDSHTLTRFVLFPTFIINKDDLTLTIKVNDEFSYILNDLANNFTRFELEEFTELKSRYSKALYRKLKQFKDTGWWEVSIEAFKDALDIPKSYRPSEINIKVLKPIENELPTYFENFRIIKKHKKARGNPIVGYRFEFKEEIIKESKNVSFQCPECGKPLIEKIINGNNCWCHEDGWKENAKCRCIFNSVSEIKGYSEYPAQSNQTVQSENEKRLSKKIGKIFGFK